MRIDRRELERMAARPADLPPPVEPRLSPADEAALIARGADPTVPARLTRIRALLYRAATPEHDDAELLVRLAVAGHLPLDDKQDVLRARQRLAGIGGQADPPSYVAQVMARRWVRPGDGAAFAESLVGSAFRLEGQIAGSEPNWSVNGSGWGA